MSERFDLWHLAMWVGDLDRSVDFYVSTLGFHLVEHDAPAKTAFVSVYPGGATLELLERPAERRAEGPIDHLAFECADLEAVRAALPASVRPPAIETFENGIKRFQLHDPDGVRLDFFQGRSIFEASAGASS